MQHPLVRFVVVLGIACSLGACGERDADDEGTESGRDAGRADADPDADGSAAPLDSGLVGTPDDAGTTTDASVADSGTKPDAGVTDAGGGTTEPTGLVGVTAAHNAARANVSPVPSVALPQLTWSSTVASAAQTWADRCVWEHGGSYGQNLYATTGSGGTGTAAVASWMGEAVNYSYASNSCATNEVCGHYTQVVWRSSTKLGCGIRVCSSGSPFDVDEYGPTWTFVVCDYDPAGNNGNRPY